MGVRSDVANYDLVFDTVNRLSLTATHGGMSEILGACRNVDKSNRIELRMDISFHRDSFQKFVLNPDAP